MPEVTEEGRIGWDASADNADEGFATGPDEHACHGPGQVDGMDQVVNGDDSNDRGHANAVN